MESSFRENSFICAAKAKSAGVLPIFMVFLSAQQLVMTEIVQILSLYSGGFLSTNGETEIAHILSLYGGGF